MSRRSLTLLLVLFLVPAVTAGDAADPELADPAGDHAVSRDCGSTPDPVCNSAPVGGEPAADDAADLLAIWVSESNVTHYTVAIETAAAGDSTEIQLSYNVTPTNNSFVFGVAEHTIAFTIAGTTSADAPANTTIARNATNATVLEVTLTRADTDAVGGDAITNLTASAKATSSGSVGPVSWTDTTTDATEGDSRPYNLTRPAKAGNLTMILTGGSLTETVNGTTMVTSFTGGFASLNESANGTANLTYTLTLSNDGIDPDDVVLSILDTTALAGQNITATVTPLTASLAPGETIPVMLTLHLMETPPANHSIFVQAISTLGGYAFEQANVAVPTEPVVTPPPTPTPEPEPEPEEEERKPVVAGLDFLTPAAEAMGLVGAFGEYAELVLLAIILLLVILIIFLVIFLATRGAIKISIEPRKMDIPPGQTAEFRVEIKNRKGRPVDALTSFEGDPEWQTKLLFGGSEVDAHGADAAMHLGSKEDETGTRHGILKVTAPEAVADKEADRVTLAVAPVREDGRAGRAQRSQIRVRAQATASPKDVVRLAGVEHDPFHPEAGQVVETTARIENDSETDTMHMRIVLNVDGDDLQEQPLVLPPQAARAVVFTWQVPAGTSKVRVRIYSDE